MDFTLEIPLKFDETMTFSGLQSLPAELLRWELRDFEGGAFADPGILIQ